MSFLLNQAINIAMLWNKQRYRRPLLRASVTPQQTQARLLKRILKQNADTEFGRKHCFLEIENTQQYRQQVPVHDYDMLAPYIQRQIDGTSSLTSDAPVFYARTSGTTGRFKDVPLTTAGLRQVRRAQKQLAISLWQSTEFFRGKILGIAGSADEGKLRNGQSFGSVSGTTYQSLSPVIASKFVAPPATNALCDIDAKYQIFALTVLGCPTMSGMVAANPSSILKLVQLISRNTERYLQALQGSQQPDLAAEAVAMLPEILQRCCTKRLNSLTQRYARTGSLTPEDIFPRLDTIVTWTGGSCGTAIRQLKPYLPNAVRFVEYGYAASEFIGSVNVDPINNRCIPQLDQHYYEFVQRDRWESDSPSYIGIEELQPDEEYYVFVTTQSGLYRYHINDIIKAGPLINHCATLEFLQKGKGVTNITGEKLSEYQLIEAVDSCIDDMSLDAGGYIALANETAARYHLYIEGITTNSLLPLATNIDNYLRKTNSEYDDKRRSDRLAALTVCPLIDDACEKIKQWSLDRGVREAQYKPDILGYSRDWQEKLDQLVLPGHG